MASASLILLCTSLTAAVAFKSPASTSSTRLVGRRINLQTFCNDQTETNRRYLPRLLMAQGEDEYDPNSLGDWRQFRMKLINSMDSSSDTVTSIDGIDVSESATTVTKKTERPKSVSRRNEEVLMAQNEDLGEEYLKGVWAHESSMVCLVLTACRRVHLKCAHLTLRLLQCCDHRLKQED